MTRTTEVNTAWFTLAYPKEGKLIVVANGDSPDREKLELLLNDRAANGEAFPGEIVAELWVNLQWFGLATIGKEYASGVLFARELSKAFGQCGR